MRVLAVDTTSAHGSVAVVEDGALIGVAGFRAARPRHAEDLLPTIELVLAHTGSALSELDLLAVAAGPGSFVGIRIGIASIAGLAYALDIPALGVSALDATAHSVRHHQGVVAAILEAYRGEVYGAVYRADGRAAEPVGGPSCAPLESLIESFAEKPTLVTGHGTPSRAASIAKMLPGVLIAEASPFLAESVARLGALRFSSIQRTRDNPDEPGRPGELATDIAPIYVRPSEAERRRTSHTTGA